MIFQNRHFSTFYRYVLSWLTVGFQIRPSLFNFLQIGPSVFKFENFFVFCCQHPEAEI